MSDEDAEVRDRPRTTDPEPVPEKPPRKVYRGEMVKVSGLEKALKSGPVPIQFMDEYRKKNIPVSAMLIESRMSYARGMRQLVFRRGDNFQLGYFDLADSAEVNILSGTQGKKISSGWAEYNRRNLHETLSSFSTTSGSDPEIFVVDSEDEVIPAWEFLKSKKEAGSQIGRDGDEFSVYWDGFQAEFTVAPAGCHMHLMDHIWSGLHGVYSAARAHSNKAKLSLHSVLPVSAEVLASAKTEHVEFGCAPSRNLYGLAGKTEDGRTCAYRFAGGHIHLGMIASYHRNIPEMVRAMDQIAAVSAVSMFAEFDSPIRRQYYGLPGEYRTPAHGLEYRTLSNAWLMHPVIYHLVFDLVRSCAYYGNSAVKVWDATEDETLSCVLNSDVDKARALMARNKDTWIGVMRSNRNYSLDSASAAYNVWFKGAESAIKNPRDIVGNWALNKASVHHQPYRYWGASYGAIRSGEKV